MVTVDWALSESLLYITVNGTNVSDERRNERTYNQWKVLFVAFLYVVRRITRYGIWHTVTERKKCED